MTPQLARIWALIQRELRRAVPDSTFEIWLAPLRPRALAGETLVVSAPDEIRAWVADRFARVLQTARPRSWARATRRRRRAGRRVALEPPRPARAAAVSRAGERDDDAAFHPKFTFDQFVIGDSNRFAHAAALAVAELPGQAYNPLFLYGPPGLGKTHLLHAIGNYVRAHGDGLRVRYTTAERFTNEFVAALQAPGTEDFKARFRDIDVLLIDDVQFLQRKAKTEEEFFHTFNALLRDRQPARPDLRPPARRPGRARGPAARALRGRPRHRPRAARLRRPASRSCASASSTTASSSPTTPRSSDRRPHHRQRPRTRGRADPRRRLRLAHRPADRRGARGRGPRRPLSRAARAARRERPRSNACRSSPARPSVCRDELLSSRRNSRVAWARQVAMYLARGHTGATLPAIGERFGGRNHTTVMYAFRKAGERIAADPAAQALVHQLERRLARPPRLTATTDTLCTATARRPRRDRPHLRRSGLL